MTRGVTRGGEGVLQSMGLSSWSSLESLVRGPERHCRLDARLVRCLQEGLEQQRREGALGTHWYRPPSLAPALGVPGWQPGWVRGWSMLEGAGAAGALVCSSQPP